jgi:hypothetical protein
MDDAARYQLAGLLFLIGIVFVVVWVISATTRARIHKEWGRSPAPSPRPSPTPSLTVREERDVKLAELPGRFQIIGVDRESKLDTTWTVNADNEANAKVKAELEGIIVTRIRRI